MASGKNKKVSVYLVTALRIVTYKSSSDMYMFRIRSVHTVKKNAEALVAATKEIGLEVNAHKTKYMTV